MRSNWNECSAHAIKRDEGTGRDCTVICDLPLHADPQDGSAQHWDSKLEIYWSYADGAGYDDEPEEQPV